MEDLHETMYAERQYGARDLDGHHWLFSAHVRDVGPAEWGATITSQPRNPALRPGLTSYAMAR